MVKKKKKRHANPNARWKKEIWKDKQGNPIGAVLVKRDPQKGQVMGIIYSKKVKERKKQELHKGKQHKLYRA